MYVGENKLDSWKILEQALKFEETWHKKKFTNELSRALKVFVLTKATWIIDDVF